MKVWNWVDEHLAHIAFIAVLLFAFVTFSRFNDTTAKLAAQQAVIVSNQSQISQIQQAGLDNRQLVQQQTCDGFEKFLNELILALDHPKNEMERAEYGILNQQFADGFNQDTAKDSAGHGLGCHVAPIPVPPVR